LGAAADSLVKKGERMRQRGQMTVEYTLMFVVIVGVMVWAAVHVIRPSARQFFNSTSRIMNKATAEVENKF
jgi:uncharacterized protein (UPF0333 family)